MFKIFYGDSQLVFATSAPDDIAAETVLRHPESFANIVENLEKYKNVWLVSACPEEEAGAFMSNFRHVDAAGGTVSDAAGRLLMIYRNDRWDLPKGHREAGEEPQQTAVREVAEETAVTAQIAVSEPFVTRHFYRLRGQWIMKRTFWYAMQADSAARTVPQTEEGITRAGWLTRAEVAVEGLSCFPSVKEVLIARGWIEEGEEE